VRALALAVVLAACSGKQTTTTTTEPTPPADDRTPIQKRRDAACEQLAPKLLECALADTKRDLDAGKLTQQQYDHDVAELREKHRPVFLKQCREKDMSSRQVRVLEVCFKEERECDPLAECLKNLEPKR
jgi:hypothetical protein